MTPTSIASIFPLIAAKALPIEKQSASISNKPDLTEQATTILTVHNLAEAVPAPTDSARIEEETPVPLVSAFPTNKTNTVQVQGDLCWILNQIELLHSQ